MFVGRDNENDPVLQDGCNNGFTKMALTINMIYLLEICKQDLTGIGLHFHINYAGHYQKLFLKEEGQQNSHFVIRVRIMFEKKS